MDTWLTGFRNPLLPARLQMVPKLLLFKPFFTFFKHLRLRLQSRYKPFSCQPRNLHESRYFNFVPVLAAYFLI